MSQDEPMTIATLGSHSALQILKGAKDEGFSTLLICEENRHSLYKRFRRNLDYIALRRAFGQQMQTAT